MSCMEVDGAVDEDEGDDVETGEGCRGVVWMKMVLRTECERELVQLKKNRTAAASASDVDDVLAALTQRRNSEDEPSLSTSSADDKSVRVPSKKRLKPSHYDVVERLKGVADGKSSVQKCCTRLYPIPPQGTSTT